jgi:hypothetical protein
MLPWPRQAAPSSTSPTHPIKRRIQIKSTQTTLYSLLIALSLVGALLAGFIGLQYSYNPLSMIESGLGFLCLVTVAGSLWLYHNQDSRWLKSSERNGIIFFGIVLGLLWAVEISLNNFIAPALPARDIMDNIFWAVIAFSILVLTVIVAFQKDSLAGGFGAGIWGGFVSGLLACCAALIMIVFGMRFILQDPLNLSEWAGIAASTGAPSMPAYFAFETLAGAFSHLVILGVVMGGLLGVLGGSIVKGIQRMAAHFFGIAR